MPGFSEPGTEQRHQYPGVLLHLSHGSLASRSPIHQFPELDLLMQ
jgi:hypothetical protein